MRPLPILLLFLLGCASRAPSSAPSRIEPIAIARGGQSFIYAGSARPFQPLGFNYDRDWRMRLLEEYWNERWDEVASDFAEMRALGANVIRIHLQFHRFVESPNRANKQNLARLRQLLDLAQQHHLYLDLTGLASYRKSNEPVWYASASEQDRWGAQAFFWEQIAKTCNGHPALFCYDLINEPVVPGTSEKEWVHPHALAGFHYVQFISKEPSGRDRGDIARAWVRQMTAAIRSHDRRTPITVGMLPFAPAKGDKSIGFDPLTLAGDLDFLSVHIYPERDKLQQSIDLLHRFAAAGKPLIVEETFPLACSADELKTFIERAKAETGVDGVLGFYWGKTPAELKTSTDIADKLLLAWLEMFQTLTRKGR